MAETTGPYRVTPPNKDDVMYLWTVEGPTIESSMSEDDAGQLCGQLNRAFAAGAASRPTPPGADVGAATHAVVVEIARAWGCDGALSDNELRLAFTAIRTALASTPADARYTRLVEAAEAMAQAEQDYRLVHDTQGDGHMETGRAWDRMRHEGDELRASLASLKGGTDHDAE